VPGDRREVAAEPEAEAGVSRLRCAYRPGAADPGTAADEPTGDAGPRCCAGTGGWSTGGAPILTRKEAVR